MTILHGQVAVISGGLGDIGRAIASELARNGADVAVADVHPPPAAQDLLADIDNHGRRGRYDLVNVGNAHAVQEWILDVEKHLGAATIIVPNAATVHEGSIEETTPSEWDAELRTNLTGAYHVARAGALRLLKHNKTGRIIFMGSWAAHAPHPDITAYCVSKAGIRMLCRCMALELAPHGILVNEIAPGYVDGGLSKQWFAEHPETREKNRRQVPVGALITPQQIARIAVFLCEPTNDHMTGTALLADGGLSLGTVSYTV